MPHWIGSLFNIVFWIFIFFMLALITIYCINLSKVDSFERNATPQIQRISNPYSTDTNSESYQAIQKLNKLNSNYMDNGTPLYRVQGDSKTGNNSSIYEEQYHYNKQDNKEEWNQVSNGDEVAYGTPVRYEIKRDVPYITLPHITAGNSTSTMTVVTTCQANNDGNVNQNSDQ